LSAQNPDPTLEVLLAAIAHGDEAAMATFYDLTCAKVFGLARLILNDEALAEEVVLDTFWQVWQQAERYRADKASPLTWLLMMTRSRSIDQLRTLRKTANDCDIETVEQELIDDAQGPEDHAIEAERSQHIRACLAQLPLIERQKLTLAFFKGLSQSEIAAYCGMPLGSVKTYIRNGMARLGELLAQQTGQHWPDEL
jgi:RNA polymerase sigma-70 factor (ECF subfamily)